MPNPDTTHIPTQVAHVQRLFQRTLCAWVMDRLSLRAQGLDRPTARPRPGVHPTGHRRRAA